MRNFATMWLVPLLGVGCGGVVSEGPEQASQALVASNGIKQNGIKQNGIKQNGAGMQIIGVDLAQAARLNVIPPIGGTGDLSAANQTPVSAVLSASTIVSSAGAALSTNGLVMPATFSDGSTQVIGQAYIEGEPWADASDSSIKYYNVRNHYVASDGTDVWGYMCGTEWRRVFNRVTGQISSVEVPIPATAVAGQWDYREGVDGGGSKVIEMKDPRSSTLITFACIDGAIGKCVRMGYAPWEPAPLECAGSTADGTYRCLQTSKELMHEACVRMVRADYCGDGMPHTVDGMLIDVFDADYINTETPYGAVDSTTTTPFGHEAEWTPKGARCMSQLLMTRIAGGKFSGNVKQYLTQLCPNKWQYDYDNKTPFSWDDGDCFGGDSTFNFSNVSWSKVASGRTIVAMDLHDRAWLRNKSVCVDDSYNRTARSFSWPVTAAPYSPWASHYNQDRYETQWCNKCLQDPNLPAEAACGITQSYY